MSKDLKSLIDKAEEEDKSRAQMEKTIDNLKLEIASLQKKLEEKKTSFKITPIRHGEEKDDSEEISILKNMINSLRQDLTQNEKEKEVLQEMVDGLAEDLEETKEKLSESMKNDLYIKTQNSLNNLIQDYSKLEKQNIRLMEQISQLNNQVDESRKSVSLLQTKDANGENLKEETSKLKGYIKELESANQSLEANLKALEENKVSVEALNQDIETLKIENQELQNQNRSLNQNLDALKRDKLKISALEASVSELNQEIDNLRKTNKELKDKDAILLAKTITAISTPKKTQIYQEPLSKITEIKSEPEKIETVENFPEITSELGKTETNLEISEGLIEEKEEIFTEVKPTQIPIEEDLEDISIGTESGEIKRKWQCPNCGNTNKSQIREQDDKTRMIYPGFYSKKYVCGQCSTEWR